MTTALPVCFGIDVERVAQSLQQAGEKVEPGAGEVVLDFSDLRRVDPSGLRALEQLARMADEKSVKVTLRGVNVEVYKVLKLSRLTSRFSCMS